MSLQLHPLRHLAAALFLLVSMVLPALAADTHPVLKRPINLAPSAQLSYTIKARHSGIPLNGSALVNWQTANGKYQINVESRAALLGKIQSSSSAGMIDAYGLAPVSASEKRFRKSATTVTFNRDTNILSFSVAEATYPLLGGEQDRASIVWQLVSHARAATKKFRVGSTWSYFVAGRSDAMAWDFKVAKVEKIATPLGMIDAVKVTRQLTADSRDQELDIWLAPALEWYPVKIRFAEPDGDVIEQTLKNIERT